MMERLSEWCHWLGMSHDCKAFCDACPQCNAPVIPEDVNISQQDACNTLSKAQEAQVSRL